MTMQLLSRPGGLPSGRVRVPGDKSISHRALILSALAKDETVIHGLLESADCLATADAMRQLGASIERSPQTCREPYEVVQGLGLHGLRASVAHIDCGNSGTAMRLLAGVLAGQPFDSVLVGDESLSRRPMRRIAEPLSAMGASIETSGSGTPPLRIRGRRPLSAIEYRLPVPSAQVKSAVLLAGLFADGETRVIESGISRDHTERLLPAFGVSLARSNGVVSVSPPEMLRSPGRIDVPGDLSSAAFLFAAAAMTPGASVTVENVGINPTRTGVLDLLSRMGATVEIENHRNFSGEPVADVRVSGGDLRGIEISGGEVALAIDEIPVLLAVAALADGETVVRGAGELKVKESDRLAAMADGLRALGIETELLADGIRVRGGRPLGGVVDSHGDHRIAMSFAVLGQRAAGPVEIHDCANIATSFPGFVQRMREAGLDISERQQ